jgi:hypothetical protein
MSEMFYYRGYEGWVAIATYQTTPHGGSVKILVEHLQSDQCENGEDANGVEEAATDQPKSKGMN